MRLEFGRAAVMAGVMLAISSAALPQTASEPAAAPGGDADLAKKLSNPVADLISVPFQFNYNGGFFEGDGDQYYLNIQPVIPFSISRDWNVISRTIVPIYSQDGVIPGAGPPRRETCS